MNRTSGLRIIIAHALSLNLVIRELIMSGIFKNIIKPSDKILAPATSSDSESEDVFEDKYVTKIGETDSEGGNIDFYDTEGEYETDDYNNDTPDNSSDYQDYDEESEQSDLDWDATDDLFNNAFCECNPPEDSLLDLGDDDNYE